jgi:hypothetical protein
MYSNLERKHGAKQFKVFLDLHENNNDQLLITWWTNLVCGFLLHGQVIPIA